jgi:lipid-A-disaccharide synthase-like uncharacterized protein
MTADAVWLAVGLVGQGLFFMRFLVQWIASEKRRESVFPRAFWHFSLFGGLTLFAYALHQRDVVFAIGQSTGVVIYLRNLMLTGAARKEGLADPA